MNSEPSYTTHLPGGHHWSLRLRRSTTLTLTAQQADSNVGLLCYNPENLLERLNLPDTLKCQHTFKLTQGHCLYSDMGRIFASITHDDLGWHDSVGGNLMPHHLIKKGWQPVSYQQAHNDWTRTGFDPFLSRATASPAKASRCALRWTRWYCYTPARTPSTRAPTTPVAVSTSLSALQSHLPKTTLATAHGPEMPAALLTIAFTISVFKGGNYHDY